jgi:hypothetical protein
LTALEDAVDNRLAEIFIVQDAAPRLQRLVGCEDHRFVASLEGSGSASVQQRARPDGIPGIHDNPGNVESITYRT